MHAPRVWRRLKRWAEIFLDANMQRPFSSLAVLLIFGLVFQSALPLLGQSKDSIVGTWVLDLSKSDFMPENDALRSRTMVFEAVDKGVKCTITTLTERGNGRVTIDSSYTAHYDGKDVPIDSSALDTVALKRIDANTIERTGKIRGQVVETAAMKVSSDGKILTVTTKGTINGEDYSSSQVFARQ
jgi:hypothetical protein